MNWTNSIQEDRDTHLSALENEDMERFPNGTNRDAEIGEFVSEYETTDEDFESEDEWTLAGRVSRINDFGDIYFFDIVDESGSVQLQFDYEHTPDDVLSLLSHIDSGDIVEATGNAIRSDSGELTLHSWNFRLLTKSLTHPPSNDGLSNEEEIRQRSLALQYDTEMQSAVRTRFELTQAIRDYLVSDGYLEVETPVLQSVYGGGSAHPFETYCAGIDEEMYLRIAPEIALKKLVIGGFENIFEIGKVFRNEDIDTTHNPEFTMLELYEAYADYEDMMDLTESLVSNVVESITGDTVVTYDGSELDFTPPWDVYTVSESVSEFSPYTVENMSDSEVISAAQEDASDELESDTVGDAVMALYEEFVESEIVQPTFIINHPSGSSPLCKTHRDDESVQERFEVVVAGTELANSYTERNDPSKQADAFEQQNEQYDSESESHHQIDESYLESLTVGLPPTGGLGIGIERLAMFVTDSQSIKDVIAFPMVSDSRGGEH